VLNTDRRTILKKHYAYILMCLLYFDTQTNPEKTCNIKLKQSPILKLILNLTTHLTLFSM